MKLSAHTLRILKNFATIHGNLLVTPGSVIKTIAEAKVIMAEATITETFTVPFGIYDLGQFLATIDMLSDPDLSFGQTAVTISSGKSKSTYRYAASSSLTTVEKPINMPTPTFTVTVPSDAMDQIRKAASVFGCPMMAITGDGSGEICLTVINPKNPSSNTFSVTLDEDNEYKGTFCAQFPMTNVKILPGDYTVEVSSKCISAWTSTSIPVKYHIALEKTSTFS
jgi:translation initiation factor IF-1